MADSIMVVGFALEGPPMARPGTAKGYPNLRPFQAMENRLTAEYTADVFALGEAYKSTVARRFAEYHGRTGRTEHSISSRWFPFSKEGANLAFYNVNMGGGVSYVLNPIRTHMIPKVVIDPAKLYGNKMVGPWKGRVTNYYSPFGPVRGQVEWYQGGDEGKNPDTTWLELARTELEADTAVKLTRLARYAETTWFDLSTPPTLLAASERAK